MEPKPLSDRVASLVALVFLGIVLAFLLIALIGFASLGSMYAALPDGPGVLDPNPATIEEENWHTVSQPLKTGVANILVGDALVSHYSFKPQGPHLAATNILDRYRELAAKLTH